MLSLLPHLKLSSSFPLHVEAILASSAWCLDPLWSKTGHACALIIHFPHHPPPRRALVFFLFLHPVQNSSCLQVFASSVPP